MTGLGKHFSIKAFAAGEVVLPEHQTILDRGMNAFSLFTEDINAVVRSLESQGIRVDEVCSLDELEPVPLSLTALPDATNPDGSREGEEGT